MEESTQNQGGIARSQPLIGAQNQVATKSTPHANETVERQKNRSEIAAFLQQWDLEIEAMQQGLHGIALTARHDFILKRMSGLIDEKKVETMYLTIRAERNVSPAD